MNVSFALVEREKLGPNAYRVGKVVFTVESSETLYALMRKRIAEEPDRYNMWAGTHALVLMASPAMHDQVTPDNWTNR